MECLKRSFHQDALGLGLLIFIDKFSRLCSPCPMLASERSFPLPCFFLISGLPRFFGRLAQSFGKGMLMFWYRHLSHWKPLVMIMKTEFFLLFCPLQMIPSLSPPQEGYLLADSNQKPPGVYLWSQPSRGRGRWISLVLAIEFCVLDQLKLHNNTLLKMKLKKKNRPQV